MEFSTYKKSDIVEIQQLFKKVFSDSEVSSEGALIERLVFDLIESTDTQDIRGLISTGKMGSTIDP